MVETKDSKTLVPQSQRKHARRMRHYGIGGRVLIYVLLALGLVLVVAPFVWMVLSSFKGPAELALTPPTWWPQAPTWQN